MLIIAGHIEVDVGERDRFVALHADLVRRARTAPGCLDVAITADPIDPARVNSFERWESRADLDAWRKVARAPEGEINVRSDHVMLYVISEVQPPFG